MDIRKHRFVPQMRTTTRVIVTRSQRLALAVTSMTLAIGSECADGLN